MMQKIKRFFTPESQEQLVTADFSAFFHENSSAEKKKILRAVVREANEDQKALVKKYDLIKAV